MRICKKIKALKYILILLIVISLLLTAVSCARSDSGGGVGTPAPSVAVDSLVWRQTTEELPVEKQFYMPSMIGETLYYLTDGSDFVSAALYSYKLGDAEPKIINPSLSTPALTAFQAFSDGVGWIAVSEMTGATTLLGVDLDTGAELKRHTLPASDGMFLGVVELPDGALGVDLLRTSDMKRGIYAYDTEAGKLMAMFCGVSLDVLAARSFRDGSLIAVTEKALVKIDVISGEQTEILDWIGNDLNYTRANVLNVSDGSVLLASQTTVSGTKQRTEFITVSQVPASSVPTQTILKLALAGQLSDYLRSEVIDFNKSNPNYRVEIVNYFDNNTDILTAAQRLNADIITGTNTADIFCMDISFSLKNYYDKGLLTDLYPYYRDSGIEMHPIVLKLNEIDGKLLTVCSGFQVLSMIGHSDIVGESDGWTLDDVNTLMKSHGDIESAFPSSVTRDVYLLYALILSIQDYYSKDDGVVNFSSPEFKALLEYAKSLPKDFPSTYRGIADEIESKKYLVSQMVPLASFSDVMLYTSMYGGKPAYKGLPSDNGGGNFIMLSAQYAVNSLSENKDGAWQFLQRITDERYQETIIDQFPSNKKLFDKRAQLAMQEPEEDTSVNYVYYSVNGNVWYDPTPHPWTISARQPASVAYFVDERFMPLNTVNCYTLTSEEYAVFERALNTIDKTVSFDQVVINVITEESAPYFEGQKSLDDVCDVIQSRLKLYVTE
jgi:ABC-type glycerol-3-phosphate transport system substrate-binding protein